MVLTKEELVGQDWWNQNVVFIEKNPADGEGYVLVYRISNFLFQTQHTRDYSQCLLDPIMSMPGLLVR